MEDNLRSNFEPRATNRIFSNALLIMLHQHTCALRYLSGTAPWSECRTRKIAEKSLKTFPDFNMRSTESASISASPNLVVYENKSVSHT